MQHNFLDQQLAQHIAPNHPEIREIVVKLSNTLAQGHTCLPLSPEELEQIHAFKSDALVVQGNLLYLKRYAQYENTLAERLLQMAQSVATTQFSADEIAVYFDDPFQAQAALLALNHHLAIITGGPGTGKTTTVVKILALLKQHHPELNIALCAPTGKAAMRLQESIANSKAQLSGFATEVVALIPEKVMTIHRLLGARPFSTLFRHSVENPLLSDIVVVDEASMIDLALMVKLLEALKPNTKLIMLGDKDQLASVESGAVLADCYEGLQQNRIELQNTYRFGGKIKALAVAINQQDSDQAFALLTNAQAQDPIHCFDKNETALQSFMQKNYADYFQAVKNVKCADDIANCFQTFNQFQVLAATREGARGVANLNALCQTALPNYGQRWFSGRPVMITRNDSNTKLFNGDIGLCLPSPEHSFALRVFFPDAQGFKSFPLTRLPEHETAFAMTIHKSQGSEFAQVLVVLPDELPEPNQLVTKELLYTAITRGKTGVDIQANLQVLGKCIEANICRDSGLQAKLLAKSLYNVSPTS